MLLPSIRPTLLSAAISVLPTIVWAQPPVDLLLPAHAASAARRDVPSRRARKAHVNPRGLEARELRLSLFDDVQVTVRRTRLDRPDPDSTVWVGDDGQGTQVVLAQVKGVLTGTVYSDHRTYQITIEPDGQYAITELDSEAFPTDDPLFEDAVVEPIEDAGDAAGKAVVTSADATTGSEAVIVDVMVLWTPRAEAAQGGRAAMESLVAAAIANANLVYANSQVHAQLRLAYGGPVNYVETPSSIGTDLNAIRSATDGILDDVHALRNTHAADIVTLIGEGYRNSGSCGIAGLMQTVSTSFASGAFNVVDRTCAVGNLSFAHEVGHNQGLHHDPANAGSVPSTPYAYGYQSPSGSFRTVLSYGSATRIPYLSSPLLTYGGLATGTASEDNARALRANVATVAAFRNAGGTSTTPPPPTSTTPPPPSTSTCTYTVNTTALTLAANGGNQSLSVSAPSGCAWTVALGVNWLSSEQGVRHRQRLGEREGQLELG